MNFLNLLCSFICYWHSRLLELLTHFHSFYRQFCPGFWRRYVKIHLVFCIHGIGIYTIVSKSRSHVSLCVCPTVNEILCQTVSNRSRPERRCAIVMCADEHCDSLQWQVKFARFCCLSLRMEDAGPQPITTRVTPPNKLMNHIIHTSH
jgi:hypothetical protein